MYRSISSGRQLIYSFETRIHYVRLTTNHKYTNRDNNNNSASKTHDASSFLLLVVFFFFVQPQTIDTTQADYPLHTIH